MPRAAGVGLIAFVIYFWPFAPILFEGRSDAIYQAIAADTYYYLKLAASTTELGFPSFDGRTISNGYMPFWQLFVILLDVVTGDTASQPGIMIAAVFWTSFALAALGLVLLSVFVAKSFGPLAALVTLPLIVPGAVFWVFQNVHWIWPDGGLNFGLYAWSFANGMESGLCLIIFSLIVPLVHRMSLADAPTRRDAVLLGTFSFLALMARLDDVFLGMACGAFCLGLSIRHRKVGLIINFAVVPLVGAALYLVWNVATVGVPLPSSGMSKLHPFFNSLPVLISNLGIAQDEHYKSVPILLAILVGLLVLAPLVREGRAGPRFALHHVLALYLLLKAGFLFVMVPLGAIGGWYLTNVIAGLNLLAVLAIGPHLSGFMTPRRTALAAPFLALAVFAMAQNVSLQLALDRPTSYTSVFRHVCETREAILADLRAAADTAGVGTVRIIDTADGAYAYCLGLPAHGVTGLGDSVAFLSELDDAGFFQVSERQGHVFVAASEVRGASYPWRETAERQGVDARRLFTSGPAEFWLIESRR